MTGWRVTKATPHAGQYWLGVPGKPELVNLTFLPCDETRDGLERAKACADALTAFDNRCHTCHQQCNQQRCDCPPTCFAADHQTATGGAA